MQNNEITHDIGHKVRIINNNVDKYFHTAWEKNGTEATRMQCATLHYLRIHKDEDVFQKDLEVAFSVSAATVTNILKVMEKEGLILRVAMEADARLKKIVMTEKGIALDNEAHQYVIRLEEGLKKGFTEEDLARFRGYLDRLTQNIVDLVDENTK